MSQYLFPGLGLDVGAKLGYDSAKRCFVFLNYEELVKVSKKMWQEAGKKDYCCYDLNADLAHAFSDNVTGKVRVDFEGIFSSHSKAQWGNMEKNNKVFFTTSINCSFSRRL